MVLPRHATVYHNTKQLSMAHLLNISNTYLDIERRAGQSGAFLQSRDVVQLSANGSNKGPLNKNSSIITVEFSPEGSSNSKSLK